METIVSPVSGFAMACSQMTLVLALAASGLSTGGGSPSDRLARLVSPEFRALDDRRAELKARGSEFRPLPSRSSRMGFHSNLSDSPDTLHWVQIDLGRSRPIDMVVVVPAAGPGSDGGKDYYFPRRYRVEIADDLNLSTSTIVADRTAEDAQPPCGRPVVLPVGGRKGRYVRFTATRLAGQSPFHFLALGEILVLSGPFNIAADRPVRANSPFNTPPFWDCSNLVDGQSLAALPLGPRQGSRSGYHSTYSRTPDGLKWVQVDLGSARPIDEIRLIPARPWPWHVADANPAGPPVRFRVEAADEPDFRTPTVLLDATDATMADALNAGDGPLVVPGCGARARYVRVTPTRLWRRTINYFFTLAELQVYSGGVNVARGAAVSALDSLESSSWGKDALVDGFASVYELLEWPDWAGREARAAEREAEERTVSAQWAAARDRAIDRVAAAAVSAGGAVVLLAVGLVWRHRVVGRRDAKRLRDQIARDLHDEIGSNLGGILLLSQSALLAGPDEARRDLAEVARIARQTADGLRDLVWLLGPSPDTAGGLLARMQETAAALLAGVDADFDAPDNCLPRRPSLEFKRQVFLVFKEAVYNAAHHSRATVVTVRCRSIGGRFVLEVSDNGKGFDADRPGGTGLRSLRARAAALHGRLDIETAPSRGTTVRLSVPMKGSR
jgi:signal transduction histidine kinase